MMNTVGILKNSIQEYAWGSKTALQEFLGQCFPVKRPLAELWMGAHPKAPSQVVTDGECSSLLALIQCNPHEILSPAVAEKFTNKLPFLFKVLAADQPLSIQAHPNLSQAKNGFSRENNQGIPIKAKNRNYRDDNHKPEIICALTTFWALNGFRPVNEIAESLGTIPSPFLKKLSEDLRQQPNAEGLKLGLNAIFALDESRRLETISELLKYVRFRVNHDPLYEWVLKFDDLYPGDVGILLAMLLNLVYLEPGDAMYLPAGQLHAYLKGMGIELMANSDNVLRGGLTEKHIDPEELMSVLNFEETPIEILRPQPISSSEKHYSTPSAEFLLSVIYINQNTPHVSGKNRSVEIILCASGFADFTDIAGDTLLQLGKGDSIVVPAALDQYKIEGKAVLYKASVPL